MISEKDKILRPMKQALEQADSRIETFRRELLLLPEGTLVPDIRNGKSYYARILQGKRTGITGDKTLVYQLARRRYLQAQIQDYESLFGRRYGRECIFPGSESAHTEETLELFRKTDLDLMRIVCSGDQFRWAREPYRTNPMVHTGPVYRTYGGIKTRSKSERVIGNELEWFGLPFRSEPEIMVDVSWMEGVGGTVNGGYKYYYPDFVILTAAGTLIIWEHLGRVDLSSYRTHNAEKIFALRQSGFCDDAHLILSYERDLEEPDSIREIIRRRILPYV